MDIEQDNTIQQAFGFVEITHRDQGGGQIIEDLRAVGCQGRRTAIGTHGGAVLLYQHQMLADMLQYDRIIGVGRFQVG